jgi:hypothetical protein
MRPNIFKNQNRHLPEILVLLFWAHAHHSPTVVAGTVCFGASPCSAANAAPAALSAHLRTMSYGHAGRSDVTNSNICAIIFLKKMMFCA